MPELGRVTETEALDLVQDGGNAVEPVARDELVAPERCMRFLVISSLMYG